MAKYIERDAFIAWLKKIPLVDLSDGRGLCRVIMEDDFKMAIKNMPESIIHDSEVEVVRCKDCIHWDGFVCDVHSEWPDLYSTGHMAYTEADDFCSYGERKEK